MLSMHRVTRRTFLGAGAALLAGRPTVLTAQSGTIRVFVGTFTDPLGQNAPTYFERPRDKRSRGLYSFTFDTMTGRAGEISLAAEVSNPFNLIVDANRRVLYACRWPTPLDGGNLTAFAVEGASLRELNTTSSGGGGPNVGVVDSSGQNLLTTNFVTDSIVCLRLNRDGSLGERTAMIGDDPDAARRIASTSVRGSEIGMDGTPGGPHAVELSRTERFAIAPEIRANQCRVMRFDAREGSLETRQLAPDAPDAGPRHLVWHPSYRYLYTAGETGSSISAWRWDESAGELEMVQNLTTRPTGLTDPNTPADIAMHPSGRFVYVTNRGAGTLAGFRIDQSTGALTAVDQAEVGSPSSWSMACDPSGQWALAAAQLGDEVVVYSVDQQTGQLTRTGQTLPVASPTCLRWV